MRRNQKALIPGQVISEVSFGFWHQMVSRRQTHLWPDIAGAFRNSSDRAQATVQGPIGRLRDFRNRIGHHHRVWSEDVQGRYDDLLRVATLIDSDLRQFIEERSRVPYLLARIP